MNKTANDSQIVVDNDSQLESNEIEFPDGGQGWLQVVSAFMTTFMVMGHMMCFGIYQQSYRLDPLFDNLPTSSISLVGGLAAGMVPLFGIFAGLLSDKYGYNRIQFTGGIGYLLALLTASFATMYWQIVLSYLLFGISCCIAYFPAMAIVSHWFKKRIGLAMGITVSGTGIGGFVLSPVIRVIINELGWRWTLRIIAVTGSIVILVSSMVLKTRLPRVSRKTLDIKALVKTSVFIRFYMSGMFGYISYTIPYYFLPMYASQYGMTTTQGALLVGIMNGASAIGRVVMGSLGDRFGQGLMLTVCLFIASFCTFVIWPLSTTFAPLVIFAVAYGISAGATSSLAFSAVSSFFGRSHIASIMGLVGTSAAIGNLFGPSSFSLINDAMTPTGEVSNFLPGIILCGGSLFIGSCLMLSLLFVKRQDHVV